MIVSPLAGTIPAVTTRVLLALLMALVACGDDADDDSGLPNGKTCSQDADCASDHCLFDEVSGVQICAEPGGSNQLEGDTGEGDDSTG